MKKWPIYIGISLILHLLLYNWLQNATDTPRRLMGDATPLHIDLIPATHHNVVPAPNPISISEPQPRLAQALSTTYKIQIAPITQPPPPSPKTAIPYKKPPTLGLHMQAYRSRATSNTPLSAGEVAKHNLKKLAQQLTATINNEPDTATPGWGALAGETVKDGTALYAAASGKNIPALITVTTMSLHSGALGHTIQKMRRHLSTKQALTPSEIELLAQLEHLGSATARDIYLALPPGWTYRTLEQSLNKLVAQGKLARQGKTHTAIYCLK